MLVGFHSFSSLSVPLEVLTVREEEVGGVETHEMDILGSHTSSVTSPLQSVPTGQNISEASKAEGATSICPFCLIDMINFYCVI